MCRRIVKGMLLALTVLVLTREGEETTLAQKNHATYLHTAWTTENGLPQNSVTSLLQSRDGYLWVGTFGGLARFDGLKFTIFDTGNSPGLQSNRRRPSRGSKKYLSATVLRKP